MKTTILIAIIFAEGFAPNYLKSAVDKLAEEET